MAGVELYPWQADALKRMRNGCVLCGKVGSGKSRTGLAYYYTQNGGQVGTPGYSKMRRPQDLYIITTARKRDTGEWDDELSIFRLTRNPKTNLYKNRVVIDSWNNIRKYQDAVGAFFIFDEQRVVGNGAWVKAFLKIAKRNSWILLSATPGDTWSDYIPVFIANGFYKNRTDFVNQHVVYARFSKFPRIERYLGVAKLRRERSRILVDMEYMAKAYLNHESVPVAYSFDQYKQVGKTRWDPYKDEPIQNASGLCYVWRRVVNSDPSRGRAVLRLVKQHKRAIIFYNFNYELEILRNLNYGAEVEVAEWNGHIHEPVPKGESWVYLVQYTAGCEGWNCTTTDTTIFYSLNYSYKVMEQATGRINRLNTPYSELHYYYLESSAAIDRAISRALNAKKNFNEGKFIEWRG